jgi:hypothetical protein
MHLSKEMFEKWRRGEVKIKGEEYPVTDLSDGNFVIANKKPDPVYGPQTDEYPEDEYLRERLDAIDDPVVQADLLYVMRKYIMGKEFREIDFEKWDGSYVSMLLIYMRHHGESVRRKDANKKYIDPEEWEIPPEVIAEFRKALHDAMKWNRIDEAEFEALRTMINDLKDKEEIDEDELDALQNAVYEIYFRDIKDEEIVALLNAADDFDIHFIPYQNAYMDVMDNGKNVRIHIWGRDDG